MNTKKAIPEISIETQLLIGLLQQAKVGDVVTYEVMSDAIGRDVQREGRGAMTTARRHAMRHDRLAFGCIVGHGLKRLDNDGTIEAGARGNKLIKRAAQRVIATTTCVRDLDKLTPTQRERLALVQSTAGVIQMFTTGETQRKVAALVHTQGQVIAPQKMLDAFRTKEPTHV